ncbi:MAG: hypothetical protein NTZ27_12740 [Ignavibacteriales bacterium]|nr:hypothetical protein [Ignavibacteriales bacterium]
MRRILEIIVSALVDVVCFLQGSIIVAYALLHFSYKVEVVRGEGINPVETQNVPIAIGGYYFFSDQYIKVALIGLALIIIGFLMRSWRKSYNN